MDGDMRHGRKSKSRVINGFKRHVATDVDSGLILAAAVRPANQREHAAEADIRPDVERLGEVTELHIDRGYLSGRWPQDLHSAGLVVLSKPWSGLTERFGKSDLHFDFPAGTASCPGGATVAIRQTSADQPQRATFPTATCRGCELRDSCLSPKAKSGKTLTLHKSEPLLQDLRDLRSTGEGRAKLRKRVGVEHCLAHVCARQGRRARYVGTRKNTFDLRRVSAVENLHCLLRRAA